MKRMMLGKTGIEAVRLGFGGIPIQRVPEAQAIEVVLYALEKGMDFIDTSRMYTMREKAACCTECGDCVERCPYGLPIPEMIKANLEWIKANF